MNLSNEYLLRLFIEERLNETILPLSLKKRRPSNTEGQRICTEKNRIAVLILTAHG